MKRTSNKKPWKEEIIELWDMLGRQYYTVCSTPHSNLDEDLLLECAKLFFSHTEKFFEHIFKDF